MTYRIEFGPAVRKELATVHRRDQAAIIARIEGLAEQPRPRGAIPLTGRLKGLYRIRVGRYRVAYHIRDDERVVTVVAVGPRGGFYDAVLRG